MSHAPHCRRRRRRRRRPRSVLVAAAVSALTLAACGSAAAPRTTPPPGGGGGPPKEWALVWSDEFDGPAGSAVDPTKWVHDTGGHGWGNRERQYYTSGTANAALDGEGRLVITARAEPPGATRSCWYGACLYTSARLLTKGKYEFTHGRVESRMRIPRGQGIWPAFWMLGANIDQVGWPRSGEIDIMENIGREPNIVHGTIHGPGYSGGNAIGSGYSQSAPFADDFHVFAVEWESGTIGWSVDGREYRRTTPADLPAGAAWVFEHPHFMLLNVAVGGNWPGEPDATLVMPQTLTVDYVRVYRR